MNTSMTSIGFYVPNSDYQFSASKLIVRGKFCFVVTSENEIIVFEKIENSIDKNSDMTRKYILFTHPQIRDNIYDIFFIKVNLGILSKPSKELIVTISENLFLNFWSPKDGHCLNNINLSKLLLKRNDKLLRVVAIKSRFLVFICKIFLSSFVKVFYI
jgi:hypothetical protein